MCAKSMSINAMGTFAGKSLLITGSTGFLGKILVEKLLRIQPSIARIFVLVRAPDAEAARSRFTEEVLRVELFRPLKEQYGGDFERFVFERVVAIPGDIGCDCNLGIKSESIQQQLFDNLDVIVNNAATTSFDERYDISLNVNTKGAMHVVEFAKQCKHVKMLVHVSTAYVIGRGNGIIMEAPLKEGARISCGDASDASNGPVIYDINAEFQWLENAMAKMMFGVADDDKMSDNLKKIGLERAKKQGWPNTYTFTKAMGEMLVNKVREALPIVIIRPSIIESTWSEPFPGWMEGTRTIDALVVAYGKGRLGAFLADPDLVVDVIPADIVVNTMIAAAAENEGKAGMNVYHVATSVANPLCYKVATDAAFRYFTENPCTAKDGSTVTVRPPYFLDNMNSFRQFMTLRYKAPLLANTNTYDLPQFITFFIIIIRACGSLNNVFPLQVMGLVNNLMCRIFAEKYSRLLRNYNFAMYLAELYEPYAFFQGRFDISNTEELIRKISCDDRKIVTLDTKCIDWFFYFHDVHFPGVVKHVLG